MLTVIYAEYLTFFCNAECRYAQRCGATQARVLLEKIMERKAAGSNVEKTSLLSTFRLLTVFVKSWCRKRQIRRRRRKVNRQTDGAFGYSSHTC